MKQYRSTIAEETQREIYSEVYARIHQTGLEPFTVSNRNSKKTSETTPRTNRRASQSGRGRMAEAVVEERPAVPARFYCHMCNVEISTPNRDFTCPLCAGGFVEELPPPAPSTSTNAAAAGGNDEQPLPLNMDVLRNELATLLASRNGPNLQISIDPGNGRVNTRGNLVTVAGNGSNNPNEDGRVRTQNLDRFDNVLLNFLLSISGETEMPTFGGSQMFFMGNLGDYAWGREGLDTIVTQLLNQMETSGPPPLPRHKIDEIPKVEVTKDVVDSKLQCSVCWEDFKLKEIVRKLPCSHLFHEDCIVPWLDLHGTCPICRKSLNGDDEDNDVNMEQREQGGIDIDTCPMHELSNEEGALSVDSDITLDGNNTTTTTNSNTSNDGASAPPSQINVTRPNVFGFGDMDFFNNDLD
uniref:RING-type E3 ubiquitin transferase n=1 Tax=Glossina pallidipes TaxID=7398 RepID=A0A1A9ZHX9_GLOPL